MSAIWSIARWRSHFPVRPLHLVRHPREVERHLIRITTTALGPASVTLMVEGNLVADDAGLLERECLAHCEQSLGIRLDLSRVNYVDDGGLMVLRWLARKRSRIIACSVFIEGLLDLEGLSELRGER